MIANVPPSNQLPDEVVTETVPVLRLRRTEPQSIPSQTIRPVRWDTVETEQGGWELGSIESEYLEEITCPQSGLYVIVAKVMWRDQNTIVRESALMIDGVTTDTVPDRPGSNLRVSQFITAVRPLLEGQRVQVIAWAASGNNSIGSGVGDMATGASTSLSIAKIGEV